MLLRLSAIPTRKATRARDCNRPARLLGEEMESPLAEGLLLVHTGSNGEAVCHFLLGPRDGDLDFLPQPLATQPQGYVGNAQATVNGTPFHAIVLASRVGERSPYARTLPGLLTLA